MDKEIKKRFLLGLLVASGTVLFIIGIFVIGSKQNLFSNSFRICAVFNNLNGLRTGDYVRFSGVKAGVVDRITFLNDSMIKVDLKIGKKIQHLIKKDAVAYISTEGLVGNKMINIRPRWKSRTSVNENDTLTVINPFDTEEIIEKLMGINDNASVLTENLAKISGRMNEKKGLFATLMTDSALAGNMKDVVRNVKTVSNQWITLSDNLEKIVHRVNSGEGLAGELITDTTLTARLKQIMMNLKLSSENSVTVTNELARSLQGTNRNAVTLMLKDTAFAGDLRQSIINLHQSSGKLNTTLDDFQKSTLYKKYINK